MSGPRCTCTYSSWPEEPPEPCDYCAMSDEERDEMEAVEGDMADTANDEAMLEERA